MMERLEGDEANNSMSPLVYHPRGGWQYAYMHQGYIRQILILNKGILLLGYI